MKKTVQKILQGRAAVVLTGLLYLALAGLLFGMMALRTKSELEIMLTQLISKVLWVDFLLVLIAALLCGRDIAGAFRTLFAPGPAPLPFVPGETERISSPCGAENSAVPALETGMVSAALPPSGNTAPPKANPARAGFSNRLGRLNRPGVWLLLIFAAGLLLVSQVAPQVHRIYYDEDIYANMAQNIAFSGQAGMANFGTFEYGEYFVNWLGYNKDPSGWPFLVSLAFQLLGTDEALAFYLNNLLLAGGILVAFFIVRQLGGGAFAALIAALVFAITPHNLVWSNTAAAETSAAFFGGLAVLSALVYLRTRAVRHLCLLAALLPLACYMRPESSLIAFWVFAALAINLFSCGSEAQPRLRHPFATRPFWGIGLVAFALIIPHVWHFYAMSGQSWGASGAKFATSFFANNVAVNGLYYLNNKDFPILFTLLALVGLGAGLAAWKGRSGRSGERLGPAPALLMLFWFLLFWGIFLFFYAGSYKYGADVRFALVCFMPIAVLAGFGADALRGWLTCGGAETGGGVAGEEEARGGRAEAAANGEGMGPRAACRWPVATLLVLILLFAWLKFVPLIRLVGQEAWGARYDHQFSRDFIKKIPNRSLVVSHVPTMFLLWGQNAIQSYAGLNNQDLIRDQMTRFGGHVYFHKSYWCNTVNDTNRSVCDDIQLRYNLEPVVVAREQMHEYGLYRMTFK